MAVRYKKNIGDWGEDIAADYLKRKGFEIVDRNYHTTQSEIDIVAKNGGDYYFIEVKTRTDPALATDLAIHPLKAYRVSKAIKEYCFRKNIGGVGVIMAGIIVLPDKLKKTVKIRYFLLKR